MTDLSLVPLEEMWKEICKRNETAVLVMSKNLDQHSDSYSVSFFGGKHAAMGLLMYAENRIKRNWDAMQHGGDGLCES